MIEHVEVIVEERSAAEALRVLLPTMLGATTFTVYEHRGKSDLLSRLADRLRGYAKWLPETWRILVVVDRDDQDCLALKTRLETAAKKAGLLTRASARGRPFHVVNRIAVEELEAWFFGDWRAVCKAYPKVDPNVPTQARFRRPDDVQGGTWEALERILQSAGYHAGGLQKVTAAREIAAHMVPARNCSPSFRALRTALSAMAAL